MKKEEVAKGRHNRIIGCKLPSVFKQNSSSKHPQGRTASNPCPPSWGVDSDTTCNPAGVTTDSFQPQSGHQRRRTLAQPMKKVLLFGFMCNNVGLLGFE